MAHIAYKRVSTLEQKFDSQLNGVGVTFDRVFKEKISGKNTDRPQLQELITYAREGDTVHAHDISRLARDFNDLRRLVDQFKADGVTVIFHKENLTFAPGSSNPLNDLLFNLMGAFAEFERKIIRERQAEGIKKAKANGVYKRAQIRHSIPPEKVAKCLELIAEGRLKKGEIAKQLDISRASIYNIIERSKPKPTEASVENGID